MAETSCYVTFGNNKINRYPILNPNSNLTLTLINEIKKANEWPLFIPYSLFGARNVTSAIRKGTVHAFTI